MERHGLSPGSNVVRPGELRVAEADGVRQLVVVCAVHPTHVVFAVAHPYVEYATNADVVVAPGVCGTAYAVVVCCSCIGTIRADRLDVSVGTVPAPVLTAALHYAADTVPLDPRWWVGPRCLGPLDARWEHAAALRTITARLAHEHLTTVFDQEAS